MAIPSCIRLFAHWARRAVSRDDWIAGSKQSDQDGDDPDHEQELDHREGPDGVSSACPRVRQNWSALMISPSARFASSLQDSGADRVFQEPDRAVAECEIGAAGMAAAHSRRRTSASPGSASAVVAVGRLPPSASGRRSSIVDDGLPDAFTAEPAFRRLARVPEAQP